MFDGSLAAASNDRRPGLGRICVDGRMTTKKGAEPEALRLDNH